MLGGTIAADVVVAGVFVRLLAFGGPSNLEDALESRGEEFFFLLGFFFLCSPFFLQCFFESLLFVGVQISNDLGLAMNEDLL